MDNEKLKQFIRLLQKVKRQPQGVFDIGLIVKEPSAKKSISGEKIFREIKNIVPIEKIVYDSSTDDENTIQKLISVFQKKNWAFLEIKKDIGSPFLNQLKHLSNRNFLQILNYNNQDVFEIKMPEDTRIVVFAERDFIENKITYPHFYRIFGPTLSIK